MSIIDDLIQVIENDDHILLSKLIENGVDLNTKIIHSRCGVYINCDKCRNNPNNSQYYYIILTLCNKCKKYKNITFQSRTFVKMLFERYLEKSLGVLVNSDIDVVLYHPEKTSDWEIIPLRYFFKNNDIVNFEKLAKKDICLNPLYSERTLYDVDLVSIIIRSGNLKYLKILFENGLKNQLNYHQKSNDNWILIAIESENYECAKFLLQEGKNLNCQIIVRYGKLVSLFEFIILGKSNNFKYYISKINNIINFFMENGFNINTKIYNKKLRNHFKKIISIKIKAIFMMCILHKLSKHIVSDFFKTNPGLYKYIGGKISNYII